MAKESSIEDELMLINNVPFIKNPLSFFASTKNFRAILSITDSTDLSTDIQIAEKMFGTLFVSSPLEDFETKIQEIRDVLKQRLRYPGINERQDLLKLAKIWILPNKIQTVSKPQEFLASFKDNLAQKQAEYNFDILSCVKIELSGGQERMIIYKMLDDGFRPSLIIVKWSEDLDSNYSTAYCAGHLVNSGYVMVDNKNGYALYFYTDASIYNTVSMKDVCYGNPIVKNFQDETEELLKSLGLDKQDGQGQEQGDEQTSDT
jgi:hypothetical protein